MKQFSERFDAGEEIPSYHRILTTENKWLAARYGLEAPVMDLATGRRNRIPIAQLVRRTVREIEPHARELGSERELEGIGELLARGNSADRQLRIFNANRDIREVVEEIAIATETLPAAPALARAGWRRIGACSSPATGSLTRASGAGRARCRRARDVMAGEGWRCSASTRSTGRRPARTRSCSSRDRSADLLAAGVRPFLVSRDSPWSHAAWTMTLGRRGRSLLSDWNGEATRGFGVACQ